MIPPPVSPRLLRAYRASVYRVDVGSADEVAFRIGRRSVTLDALLVRLGARTACLLGADNPGSRRRPAGWNRRARARLSAALRRVSTLPAVGEGRGWGEAHVLAVLPVRRGMMLARRFRQSAFLVARLGVSVCLIGACGTREKR